MTSQITPLMAKIKEEFSSAGIKLDKGQHIAIFRAIDDMVSVPGSEITEEDALRMMVDLMMPKIDYKNITIAFNAIGSQ